MRVADGIQWPVDKAHPKGTERLYTDGVFPTDAEVCETFGHDLLTGGSISETEHRAMAPAGRAFLKGAAYSPAPETPDGQFPFRFTTGRTVHHFHTRTKTGRARRLEAAAPDAWVELNVDDAAALGVIEGDRVLVESPRGGIEVTTRIGEILPGTVFAPFHYGSFDPEGDTRDAGHRQANELTMTVWDPVSKQPTFKTAACRVSKVD